MRLDGEGYCEMQMWAFMEKFGQYVGLGRECPFDTVIYFKGNEPCHADPQPSTPSETTSEETPSRT
jgi:hypothetical protein